MLKTKILKNHIKLIKDLSKQIEEWENEENADFGLIEQSRIDLSKKAYSFVHKFLAAYNSHQWMRNQIDPFSAA